MQLEDEAGGKGPGFKSIIGCVKCCTVRQWIEHYCSDIATVRSTIKF